MTFHPVAQGFLHDQGLDPERRPTWTLIDVLLSDLTVESTDPVRLRIRFEGDGESLVAVMEADARISRIERQPEDAG